MDGTNALKENTLGVNVFYRAGKGYGRRTAKALRRSVRL
jgi:hypothetical protein